MREKALKTRIEWKGYNKGRKLTVRQALDMLKRSYHDLHKILDEQGTDESSLIFKDVVSGVHYYFILHFKRITPQTPKAQPQLRHIITSRTKPIALTRDDTVYTVVELADLLRVSRLTVLDLIYKGEIEAFAIGSSWRITGTALNAYINENMERLKEAVSGRKNKGTN